MNEKLIHNLRGLAQALILVLLLGAGLWLMDQVARTSQVKKAPLTATQPGEATPAARHESSAPLTDPSRPQQEPAGLRAENPANNPAAPASPADKTPASEIPGKEPSAAPIAATTKEIAASSQPSPPALDLSSGQSEGRLPRIVNRPEGRFIATKPILFNTAMATIRQVSVKPLKDVAALLKQHPDMKLTIFGFTDNLGLPENNLRVSGERAAAVREFLMNEGIAPSRLESRGMGSQNPIAPNDTQIGRQANRRIEFLISGPK